MYEFVGVCGGRGFFVSRLEFWKASVLPQKSNLTKRNTKKPRGRVWPGLTSVGGDIQPQVVTVLTPATQRRWQNFSPNLKFVNAKKLAK